MHIGSSNVEIAGRLHQDLDAMDGLGTLWIYTLDIKLRAIIGLRNTKTEGHKKLLVEDTFVRNFDVIKILFGIKRTQCSMERTPFLDEF